MIEEAVVNRLLNDPGIQGAVGTRIYPGVAPDTEPRPYIVYLVISRPRIMCQDGPVNLGNPRMRLTVYGDSYASCRAVATAMDASLSGFAANMPGGFVQVQGCFVDDEIDDYEPPAHGDDVGLHRMDMELLLWFRKRV